ncbi:TPA_asm: EamA family transporter [Listeria monocytogenes]|uniref:Multidrug efflux SMR transporter n=1 Tax=Listeria monocytogenes TaxID=1639 RepID=L8BU42_LISMN|nr:quaternary ammonium compound efflux SMR transporter QacH [Listeria monocytogenes]EAG6288392.1 multidrug efflux SMR transporter [Listeria monocytogenes CFSAN003825]EAG6315646.1 multidrug efflux SMR transporter [Listeria monocytogenes CFSAN003824]EAG6341258.1 multidrug efflux SMR transporter [Listeria monocytogenes CFSAN003811]AVS31666.1 QacE family quaternary ammonium compound efflux SMR transporter [Listeria monocytogenes]EAA0154953.1 multidrug efflux SMR transporter [Listeria monocytogenes
MSYLYLALAIVGEIIGSSLLKASEGFSKLFPTIGVIIAFVVSFFFLSLSLKTIPLNTAYSLWSGLGLVLTTIISVLIWKEKLNMASIAGITLILAGVVILNLFGPGHGEPDHKASETITINEE